VYFDWIKVLDANPTDSRHMIEGFVDSTGYGIALVCEVMAVPPV